MYINFGVGLHDNKDNVWKKFGDQKKSPRGENVEFTHADDNVSVDQGENFANEVNDTLWPVSEILGEEVKDGKLHYLIRWQDTLEPAENIEHLTDVVKDWDTRVRALKENLQNRAGTKRQRDVGSDAVTSRDSDLPRSGI
jgi:hypothetical protein